MQHQESGPSEDSVGVYVHVAWSSCAWYCLRQMLYTNKQIVCVTDFSSFTISLPLFFPSSLSPSLPACLPPSLPLSPSRSSLSLPPSLQVWSCVQCYCLFHLQCIQQWARDGERQLSLLSLELFPGQEIRWSCPKCRLDYPTSQFPKTYVCFCGKQV